MSLPPQHLQLLRGWLKDLALHPGLLLDGEPAKLSVDTGDSGVLETLWVGAHDGRNVMVGGGFQILSYAGPPQFPAPVGLSVLDPQTAKIWVSQGWQTDPYGLSQATNPTPFLGWFGFCACVVSGAEAASSGNSSAGGGGVSGGIVTSLCPDNPLPTTLYATISGFTTCTCFNGSFALDYAPGVFGGVSYPTWVSASITGCPGQTKAAFIQFGEATDGTWKLQIGDSGGVVGTGDVGVSNLVSVTCMPFVASGSGNSAGNILDFCSDGLDLNNIHWTVTT